MDTTRFYQMMCIVINRRDRMNFIPLIEEGFHKIHPEIVDIPGSVEDDSDSHLGSVYENNQFLTSDKQSKKQTMMSNLKFELSKVEKSNRALQRL
jgi:hypothetical protein